jgi:hypothetical protein
MNGLKILREIIDEYGIPEAFYFDQARFTSRRGILMTYLSPWPLDLQVRGQASDSLDP